MSLLRRQWGNEQMMSPTNDYVAGINKDSHIKKSIISQDQASNQLNNVHIKK